MPKHMKDFNGKEWINQIEEMTFLNLQEIAQKAAKTILSIALESEVRCYISEYKDKNKDGKQDIVRNGYHKPREIMLSGGMVEVCVPRTRNRSGERNNFVSKLVPPYMRKSLTMEEAIPLLYLYGISEQDIEPVLKALFGGEAKGVSASSISRMKQLWEEEYSKWRKRQLTEKEYCYVWVDGIYFNTQGSEDKLCTFVMIGAGEDGVKEIIAVEEGYRESAESWSFLLTELKNKGMKAPKLFIGDGSLGFWKAAKEVYPKTKWQRCWVHKTANILDKLPKPMQSQAKKMLVEIYTAPDRESAEKAYLSFVKTFEAKYPRAVECLEKDLECMLEFYNFPAEQWIHIRSSNVIESSFSTVRLRTKKMRGCGSRTTVLVMVFKLLEKASKRWKRLRGYEKIPLVLKETVFKDGLAVEPAA